MSDAVDLLTLYCMVYSEAELPDKTTDSDLAKIQFIKVCVQFVSNVSNPMSKSLVASGQYIHCYFPTDNCVPIIIYI